MANLLDDARAILELLNAAYTPNNPIGPTPADLLNIIDAAQGNLDAAMAKIAAGLPPEPPRRPKSFRVKKTKRARAA